MIQNHLNSNNYSICMNIKNFQKKSRFISIILM